MKQAKSPVLALFERVGGFPELLLPGEGTVLFGTLTFPRHLMKSDLIWGGMGIIALAVAGKPSEGVEVVHGSHAVRVVAELLAEQEFASTQGVLSEGIAFLQHLAAGRRVGGAIASTCSALMRVGLLVFEIDQTTTSPASGNVARAVGLVRQYIEFRDGFPAVLRTERYQLEHGTLALPL